jgi:GAF domain-containing protein
MYDPRRGKRVSRSRLFNSLLEQVRKIVASKSESTEKLAAICKLFRKNVFHYNWVGFYLVNPERQDELLLGPYEGEPTEHVRIPFGRGICGQAAQTRKTFVVQDISKEKNYLSCSLNVKAEIVVPIFKKGKVIGEIDIDSHVKLPFTHEDEEFLDSVVKLVSKIL